MEISKSATSWAAVPLRLIVGFGMMAHGLAKVQNGPAHFIDVLAAIGVPSPALAGWTTIFFELVGGAAVLAGFLVPLFTFPLAAILLVAAGTVHWQYGFSSIKLRAVTAAGAQFGPPGYEVDLLYLACLVAIVIAGSGPLSINIRRRDG